MRKLILNKIEEIKAEENGFKTEKWDNFFCGAYHISDFVFDGIPTDEMLLEVYNEVLKFYHSRQVLDTICDGCGEYYFEPNVAIQFGDFNLCPSCKGRTDISFE